MATEPDIALVIGGTRGLGLALVEEAVRRGCLAVSLGRTADPFAATRSVMRVAADISDPRSWHAAFSAIEDYVPSFVFWNAGIFKGRVPLDETDDAAIDELVDTHLRGPVKFLSRLHRLMTSAGAPYHLITIASTSSYRLRENETMYCAVKAAKAAFTRQFSRELARDLPGSKTLLVNPGGMKSGFLAPYADVSKMMEPSAVAKIVWDEMASQGLPFAEINIIRNDDGTPRLERGTKPIETP